jgi:hypothetical protein
MTRNSLHQRTLREIFADPEIYSSRLIGANRRLFSARSNQMRARAEKRCQQSPQAKLSGTRRYVRRWPEEFAQADIFDCVWGAHLLAFRPVERQTTFPLLSITPRT